MKKITEYNHLIEKEMTKYKQDTRKIIDEFENKFNKGSIVATHHFNNASPELIGLVKSELEEAGFRPELIGNKPDGHVALRVSLLRSSEIAASR
ncbi:hypothetical protein [Labilibaculum euxinus]|uniref:Uncharacterized protein n=1 Tax=Labilibaculum euxinus TaxID=2686357 RepID=A0A7M4D0Y0_9BACT|nr:hypothetical protein [Labilibaculum euxinus]MUP36309.1 hypothetical protein [Labilibaculum euxinus]MVB05514.1 hypothetical protein [Labilibaculum euxinus]